FYALTDRRVILWNPLGGNRCEVRSIWPAEMSMVFRVEQDNGDGDIILKETPTMTISSAAMGPAPISASVPMVQAQNMRLGIFNIKRVREVEAILRKTLLEPPGG